MCYARARLQMRRFAGGSGWSGKSQCRAHPACLSHPIDLAVCRSRDFRILILPGALYILSQVSGIITVSRDGHGYDYASHQAEVVRLTNLYFMSSLALNVIVTGLIIGRLVYASRQLKQERNPYGVVVRTLVESGSLYLVVLVVYLILYTYQVSETQ